MSGGAFDYQNYKLNDIADMLRGIIAKVRTKQEYYEDYSEDFLKQLIITYNELKILAIRLHRLDWCLSADDSENTYWERLTEDMENIELDNPANDALYLCEESGEL